MPGFRSVVPLLSAATMLVVNAAWADVPEPGNSIVPAFMEIGGMPSATASQPLPRLPFTVSIRDFANRPVPDAEVVLDFQVCTDLRLCTVAANGVQVDCASKRIIARSDAAGQVVFVVLGAAVNPGTTPPAIAPGAGASCVRIYADGVQLSTATAVIYDQDGAIPPLGVGPGFRNGVNGGDLSVVLTDVGASNLGAPYRGRTDYSKDGVVNGFDLAVFLEILGLANAGIGSAAGCAQNGVAAPYCPN